MAATDAGTAPAKSLQACDQCRSLKIRCQPSFVPGLCMKCSRSGAQCKIGERKPRPTTYKKTGSRAQVADLERQLKEANARSAAFAESLSAINTPGTSSGGRSPNDAVAHMSKLDGGEAVLSILNSCDVTTAAAEQYIARFRAMSSYFPFVVLPQDMSFPDLAQHSPFLCLAAVCVASSSSLGIQRQIEPLLRKHMLYSLTIDGDRSLDLLQALLTYLGWYQFFCTPKRDQSHMLTQLAISVCIDLGLNMSPAEAVQQPYDLRLGHYRKRSDEDSSAHDEFFSKTARRAYLGCYFVAAQSSLVSGKPSRMAPTKYMLQCAQSLANEPEQMSDFLLLPFLRLQRLGDECHSLLVRTQKDLENDPAFIHIIRAHLDMVQQKLGACRLGALHIQSQSMTLELLAAFAEMHAHELDLVSPLKRQFKDKHGFFDPDDPRVLSRHEILLCCFRSALSIAQLFLQIPVEDYTLLSHMYWLAFSAASAYLFKFCVGLSRAPEWDVRFARHTVDLSHLLGTISDRLYGLLADDKSFKGTEEEQEVLFTVYQHILQDLRRTWERLKDLPITEAMNDKQNAHRTKFPGPADERHTANAPPRAYCPAKSFWQNQSHALDAGLDFNIAMNPAWGAGYGHLNQPTNDGGLGDSESSFDRSGIIGDDFALGLDQHLWRDWSAVDEAGMHHAYGH